MVGGMLILVTQVPLPVKVPGVHFKWLYCCRGPSVERLDSPALAALIEHAHRIASKEHAVLLRLEPNIANDDPDMDACLEAYPRLPLQTNPISLHRIHSSFPVILPA